MQCAACHAVYPDAATACPDCQDLALQSTATNAVNREAASDDAVPMRAPQPSASTLIEFPGAGRTPKPQWRKDLSERVREIQQRRALEEARDHEENASPQFQASFDTRRPDARAAAPAGNTSTADESDYEEATATPATQLGLVPARHDAPPLNPLVAAALKRIERARQPPPAPTMTRGSRHGGAATAVARVAEESYHVAVEPAPAVVSTLEPSPAVDEANDTMLASHTSALACSTVPANIESDERVEQPVEPVRAATLVVVPPAPVATPVTASAAAAPEIVAEPSVPPSKPHRVVFCGVLDEAVLARREAEMLAAQLTPSPPVADDPAPFASRLAGGVVDLVVLAFASSPFAAIIELTNGNWADPRVAFSMVGIVLVLMFLYVTASTALAGRTWGMSLVGLRTVDARTGMAPSTGQCVRRAVGFIMSLALAGLGLLCALINAERRALHDLLSGTVVVRE